jgi:hypothetical protein
MVSTHRGDAAAGPSAHGQRVCGRLWSHLGERGAVGAQLVVNGSKRVGGRRRCEQQPVVDLPRHMHMHTPGQLTMRWRRVRTSCGWLRVPRAHTHTHGAAGEAASTGEAAPHGSASVRLHAFDRRCVQRVERWNEGECQGAAWYPIAGVVLARSGSGVSVRLRATAVSGSG